MNTHPVFWHTQQVLLTVCLLAVIGCGKPKAEMFRESRFTVPDQITTDQGVVLCFDLGASDQPLAGLILTGDSLQEHPLRRQVALPFKTFDTALPESAFPMTGSFSNLTLISARSPAPEASIVFEFTPDVHDLPEGSFDASGLKHTVYFGKEGLERRFYFKYPPSQSLKRSWDRVSSEFETSFDSIAVALPERNKPIVIPSSRTKSATNPLPMDTNDYGVDFYPAKPTQGAEYIEIRYEIPLSHGQKELLRRLAKLFIVLIPPLFTLAFATPDRVRDPKMRRKILWVGAISEFIALVGVCYFGYLQGGGGNAIIVALEFIEPAIGAVASGILGTRLLRT